MKIANIVFEKELVNHSTVEYVNYFNEPKRYDDLNKSFPTLYVGWSFMKLCNPDNEIIQNADILKKRIVTNELYWEFSFDESKSSHIKGIEGFINAAPTFYFQSKYTYINLDPVFFQIVDVQGLMDVLPKEKDVVYNYKNEMVYVLKENKISGVDLKTYAFFQFNINEIIENLQNANTAVYINDMDGQAYLNQYKIFPNFTHLKRYMPIIMTNRI